MGRPRRPYDHHTVTVRFAPDALALLDAWPGAIGRTEKLNRLVREALGAGPGSTPEAPRGPTE